MSYFESFLEPLGGTGNTTEFHFHLNPLLGSGVLNLLTQQAFDLFEGCPLNIVIWFVVINDNHSASEQGTELTDITLHRFP
jgi:hypothetical protein